MSNDKTAKQAARDELEKKEKKYSTAYKYQERKNNELTLSLNSVVDVAHICVMWQMNSLNT